MIALALSLFFGATALLSIAVIRSCATQAVAAHRVIRDELALMDRTEALVMGQRRTGATRRAGWSRPAARRQAFALRAAA